MPPPPPPCCFQCTIERDVRRTQAMIHYETMPLFVWDRFRMIMLIPFLYRLSASDGKNGRLLPKGWITRLPFRRPPTSLRQLFYDMCVEALGDNFVPGCVQRLYNLGFTLVQSIWDQMPATWTPVALTAQLKAMRGQDPVLGFVLNMILDEDDEDEVDVEICAEHFVQTGVVDHALLVLDSMQADCDNVHKKANLACVASLIRERMRDEAQRRVAVGMVLCMKVGSDSSCPMNVLSPEMIRICLDLSDEPAPKLVRWNDVVGDCIW